MTSGKVSSAPNWSAPPVQSGVAEETARSQSSKINTEEASSVAVGTKARTYATDARSQTDEMRLKGNSVEASLRQQVSQLTASQNTQWNGLRIGWLNDGSEVKITRSLSPAGGHETRMDAISYARLSGADPTAVVRNRDGKYHAVQLTRNFHGGTKIASDHNLREIEGLPHFDKKKIADIQKQITDARDKGDHAEATRLQKYQAALIFGVDESQIHMIRSSSDRIAGKININAGKAGGGMHGAEKAPNTNFDPNRKSAMEIGLGELADPQNAPAIIFHENSHAKDYALTQRWVKEYEREMKTKFVPGDHGDPNFTLWVNSQAPKRLSRADAELVSDVSGNANGSTEAKAYVGTFLNALKAGNPETAAAQLRTYAAGMVLSPQTINRPTGAHVELELKRQLEAEYRKMPKEMQRQFDQTFQELAQKYPDAWISKFKKA